MINFQIFRPLNQIQRDRYSILYQKFDLKGEKNSKIFLFLRKDKIEKKEEKKNFSLKIFDFEKRKKRKKVSNFGPKKKKKIK
jgi:hypothetical protein